METAGANNACVDFSYERRLMELKLEGKTEETFSGQESLDCPRRLCQESGSQKVERMGQGQIQNQPGELGSRSEDQGGVTTSAMSIEQNPKHKQCFMHYRLCRKLIINFSICNIKQTLHMHVMVLYVNSITLLQKTCLYSHLSKCGTFPFRLNGYGVGSPQENLIDVFFAEFRPFILLVHECTIGPFSQKILYFFLGKLLYLFQRSI